MNRYVSFFPLLNCEVIRTKCHELFNIVKYKELYDLLDLLYLVLLFVFGVSVYETGSFVFILSGISSHLYGII